VIKKHRKFKVATMRRRSRIFLCDLNTGKAKKLFSFLRLCRDTKQYFIDLLWRRGEFDSTIPDKTTTHLGRDRFGIMATIAQALAKEAKELARSVIVCKEWHSIL
jgi:hypothetical protein